MYNYSFIIPHKNCSDLLKRCVDSIPVRDDVQIIVVDDNSDEGNKPALSERKDLKIVLLDASQSKGAGRARNVGLTKAEGKWLLFADADDFFEEGLLNILDEYKDSEVDIVYFNFKRCENDDASRIVEGNNNALFAYCEQKSDYRYFRTCFSSPWAKMFKKTLIESNSIKFQELKANNDTYFVVKAGLTANSIEAVNMTIYWYVHRPGSIANHQGSEPFEKVLDRVKAHRDVQNLLSQYGVKTRFYLPSVVSLAYVKHHVWGCRKFVKNAKLKFIRYYLDLICSGFEKTILKRDIQSCKNYNFGGSIIK